MRGRERVEEKDEEEDEEEDEEKDEEEDEEEEKEEEQTGSTSSGAARCIPGDQSLMRRSRPTAKIGAGADSVAERAGI